MIKRLVTAKNLGLAAAVMACVGVFMLYTRPEFLITLADQVWACF
jgi:hypothetical protein